MAKFIETQESIDYKKRLKEFQQLINPKPDAAEIEKRMQQSLAERGTSK
jgi:hypothetical protein